MALTVADGGFFDDAKEEREFKITYKASDYAKIKKEIKPAQLDNAHKKLCEFNDFISKNFPGYFGGPVNRIFIHIDFDAFYVSCELLEKPYLKNKPVAVGSEFMIVAASYEARKFGVKSGMPGYHGKILCPHLTIVDCNMQKYQSISEKIMSFLTVFDKNIEIYGIDEAYISFTAETFTAAIKKLQLFNKKFEGTDFTFENIYAFIDILRSIIHSKMNLTCSAGISISRGLAKFCTSVKKPNGQFFLHKNILQFLEEKPVKKLNGVGSATEKFLLMTENIHTIGDFYRKIINFYFYLPEKSFRRLFFLSRGFSIFDITEENRLFRKESKSVGNSKSFRPTADEREIRTLLYNICEKVAIRMGSYGALVIHIQLKYREYDLVQKQRTLKRVIYEKTDIYNRAWELYMLIRRDGLLRNIMVRLVNLIDRRKFYAKNCIIKNKNFNRCFFCHAIFYAENDFLFNSHVNDCLSKQKDNRKLCKKNLLKFFRRK